MQKTLHSFSDPRGHFSKLFRANVVYAQQAYALATRDAAGVEQTVSLVFTSGRMTRPLVRKKPSLISASPKANRRAGNGSPPCRKINSRRLGTVRHKIKFSGWT
jgi:hypothetical protein